MVRSSACATLMALSVLTACSDLPSPPTADGDAAALRSGIPAAQVQDVPAVTIDLPPEPRPWDTSAVALEQAIAEEDGHAVIAFKTPASPRALETGRREAIPQSTIDAALAILAQRDVTVIEYYWFMGAAHVLLPAGTATLLRDHPLVDYIEPRQRLSVQGVEAPLKAFGRASPIGQTIPWGMDLVRAPEAWDSATGATARIQIIDTGHDRGHVDLPLVPLPNCAGPEGGCDDGPIWHGTHVLGIFTARNNTIGVIGVAHGVAPSDVFFYGACSSYTGGCFTDQVISGIQASIFFDVLSMSLGGTVMDAGMANAVAQAWSEGVVLVAGAGNRGSAEASDTHFYPAEYTNVIGVSGVKTDGSFAGSSPCTYPHDPSQTVASNEGVYVDLAAPFWALSTVGNNGYQDETSGWCGTSMATPHVSGAAALLREQNPTWTNQQIVDRLFSTADGLGAGGRDDFLGHGVLDAARAVGVPDPPPPPSLNVTIFGPTMVPPDQSCFYSSTVSGGTGIYSYVWRRNGVQIGTGSSVNVWTGDLSSYTLRLDVSDSGGADGSDELSATVKAQAMDCLM